MGSESTFWCPGPHAASPLLRSFINLLDISNALYLITKSQGSCEYQINKLYKCVFNQWSYAKVVTIETISVLNANALPSWNSHYDALLESCVGYSKAIMKPEYLDHGEEQGHRRKVQDTGVNRYGMGWHENNDCQREKENALNSKALFEVGGTKRI
jgi:hypothetical protein